MDLIRPELLGAPVEYRELQEQTQAENETVRSDQREIGAHLGDQLVRWIRAEVVDGTGPMLSVYFRWAGPVVQSIARPIR
ncbi:MAG: hypothetical protein ACLQBB_04370 [Solirubrobacteraceae bacterium]